MMETVVIDGGFGNGKAACAHGVVVVPSYFAVGKPTKKKERGLESVEAEHAIALGKKVYFVGEGAIACGRPIESQDHNRVLGAEEFRAMAYALIGRCQDMGAGDNLEIVVALPDDMLTPQVADGIRSWLQGEHRWEDKGKERSARVSSVRANGQAIGALFYYLLDENGALIPARAQELGREIGVISLGFGTVELAVAGMSYRNGKKAIGLVDALTGTQAGGVRELLELTPEIETYELSQTDSMLRRGEIVPDKAWERLLADAIQKQWGDSHQRFARVVAVGGGVYHAAGMLQQVFGGKLHIPSSNGIIGTAPVTAIAEGLYRKALHG